MAMGAEALLDFGNYPEINAQGIGDFYVIGDRARFIMFDWFREGAVWQRRVVGVVTRPILGLREEHIILWQKAMHCKAPVEGAAIVH